MALRFADFRIDANSLQELPDGSIRIVGQLTHPGIFSYRNPDGSERKEYRPSHEVLKDSSLKTFAGLTVTLNHPITPNGERLVTPFSWKGVTIGHVGDNVRADGDNAVADIYIKDAGAIDRVKKGDLRHVSCGYTLDFDPTPGTTEKGERYDGVQRNIRGNHVALLPTGIAPRGGTTCVLRLDSAGDEIASPLNSNVDEIEKLNSQITALQGELAKARTDAAEVATLKASNTELNAKVKELEGALAPERLDALVEDRSGIIAAAKGLGVETLGEPTLAIKRAVIAKRTPQLATRVDSMGAEALDAVLAVYASGPHPTLVTAVAPVIAPVTRTDAQADPNVVPKVSDLYANHLKQSQNAWKNSGDKPGRNAQ